MAGGPAGRIAAFQSAMSTPKGAGDGRDFTDSRPGASVFGAHDPLADSPAGPASARVSSNSVHDEAVKAFYLVLQRADSDANRGDTALVSLTADGYTMAVADASSFNVSSRSNGSVETRGATVPVPIRVIGTGIGELPSSLTIFAAHSAGVGGAGDSFGWFFDRGIVH